MRAIYWVRDDLRLHDNLTLSKFIEHSHEGVLVWVPSRSFLRAGLRRRAFILHTLKMFGAAVAQRGGRLVLLQSDLSQFVQQNQVQDVYFTTAATTEEQQDEATLRLGTTATLHGIQQNSLLANSDLPFKIQNLPDVFTSYRKMVEPQVSVRPPLGAPKKLPPPWPFELDGVKEFHAEAADDFHPQIQPGEAAGLARIQEYFWQLDRLRTYKETRDGMLDWQDSSKLSPWLSIGALSPREIQRQIKLYEAERGANESTYWLTFELLWRDYFRLIALKKGAKLFTEKTSSELSPSQQEERFAAWCAAKTGDDFVDANMHELNLTGWMSNRGRQNVASYLAKTLQVPWQWGASYFEEQLIDYDPSSNWGNWAYLAGVGQDPRNRIFNTQLQASRYDTDGSYRRKWNS